MRANSMVLSWKTTLLAAALLATPVLANTGFEPPQATATLQTLSLLLLSDASDPYVDGETFEVQGPGSPFPIPVTAVFVLPRFYRLTIPASELQTPGQLLITEIAGFTRYTPFPYTLNPPPRITLLNTLPEDTLPDGGVGIPFQFQSTFTGGTAPFTWSISSGTIAPGLTVGASNGLIAGTPTQAGSFLFFLRITDALGVFHTEERFLTIRSSSGPLSILTGSPLPGARRGSAYSTPLQAIGGQPPLVWSTVAGTLPPGVALSAAGTLSGTPTTDGVSLFTVRVNDSAAASVTRQYSLTVISLVPGCEITPRNRIFIGHAASNHLGDAPFFPDHFLTVTVRLDTTPLANASVTIVSDTLAFSPSRTLPNSKTASGVTNAQGAVQFRINPEVAGNLGQAQFIASGTASGASFQCTGSAVSELGGAFSAVNALVAPAGALAFLESMRDSYYTYTARFEEELDEILTTDRDLYQRAMRASRLYTQLAKRRLAGASLTPPGLNDYREVISIFHGIEARASGDLRAETARLREEFERGPMREALGLPPAELTATRIVPNERKDQDRISPLPTIFEPNLGQADRSAAFITRGPGYTAYFTARGMVLADHRGALSPVSTPPVVRMEWVGANAKPAISGDGRLPSFSNYIKGQDPRGWRTNVPHYSSIRYTRVFPGVDLQFHGAAGRLEFDLRVAPGADPNEVWLKFPESNDVFTDGAGNLLIAHDRGTLRLAKPLAYQEGKNGERTSVQADFKVRDGQAGFTLGSYDRSRPLIIDPVVDYASFLGGGAEDSALQVALDAAGHAYIVGGTFSADYPLAVPVSGTRPGAGNMDAFVTKLNPAGNAILYSTYIGGSSSEIALAIAVDAAGSAYITGGTGSANFPVLNPATNKKPGSGGSDYMDVFVAKLNPAGSALVYSTMLGGTNSESGKAIALGTDGSAYITGFTGSSNYPAVQAFQAVAPVATPQSPLGYFGSDAFVTKLNPAGSQIVYSTYLGGTEGEMGSAIAVDATGNAYVTGATYSTDFPIKTPLQVQHGGGADLFVTVFAPAGNTLVYSTYFGGVSDDMATAVALDAQSNVFVAGSTGSPDFPTKTAIQAAFGDPAQLGTDGFALKLAAGGGTLLYSTFLGGSGVDSAMAIAVGANGNAYVSGNTHSANFPVAGFPQVQGGGADAFVVQLDSTASAVAFARMVGGASDDINAGLAIDPAGNIVAVGTTLSRDFPVAYGALQKNGAGSSEAFVTRISPGAGSSELRTMSSASLNGPVAPGSIATGKGLSIAIQTASTGVPTPNLGGASLQIRDSAGVQRTADIYYVSPTQTNFFIPSNTAAGLAEITLTAGAQSPAVGTMRIDNVAPGLYTVTADGKGVASALSITARSSGTNDVALVFGCSGTPLICTGLPISLGGASDQVFLSLYGTGIRRRSSLAGVSATVGGVAAPIQYAGEQGSYPGLDQVNVGPLPRTLIGRGEVEVVVTVDGVKANVVKVTIQ